LYFSIGMAAHIDAVIQCLAGEWFVLLSYADVVDGAGRGSREFWLSTKAEKEAHLQLFLAGNSPAPQANELDYAQGVRNRLLSYAFLYDWAKKAFAFWVDHPKPAANVFLDSGAFSALSRGTVINLEQYCDYIDQHKAELACYAALDVIGDYKATAINVDYMRKRGLDPIPAFHRGSPYEELERLCKEHTYVALGGMVGKNDALTPEVAGPHLDACFAIIERHWPIKVHIFGVLAQWVLERYPFYSADSSSAIMGAGMGRVMQFENGVINSRPWTDVAQQTYDGVIMDGVGRADGSAHQGRRRRNVEAQLALERYITDLWTSRGVVWD
jgi:hypothetical protein